MMICDEKRETMTTRKRSSVERRTWWWHPGLLDLGRCRFRDENNGIDIR